MSKGHCFSTFLAIEVMGLDQGKGMLIEFN